MLVVSAGRRGHHSPMSTRIAALVALATLASCAPPPKPAPPPKSPQAAPPPAAPAPAAAAPAAPPLKLAEGDAGELVGVVVLPSIDRTAASAVALAKLIMPLPWDVAGIKAFVATRSGLPPELVNALDLGRPVGVALLLDAETRSLLAVQAIALASKDAFVAGLAKMGPPVSRRGAAQALAVPNRPEPIWILVGDDVAFVATDALALERGARTAEKLVKSPPPAGGVDLLATTWPDRLKTVAGLDLEAGAAAAVMRMGPAIAQMPNGEVVGLIASALLPAGAKHIAEAEAVQLVGTVSGDAGVSLGMRLKARPGTTLHQMARTAPGPITVPGPILEAQPVFVYAAPPRTAGDPTPFWDAILKGLSGATGKAARAAATLYKSYFESSNGAAAMAARGGKSGLVLDGVLGLKDDQAGERYLDEMAEVGGPALAEMMKMPGQHKLPMTIKLKRDKIGGRKALATTFDVAKGTPERAMLEKIYGKLPATSWMAASGPRIAVTFNGDAKARIGKLLKAEPKEPAEPTLRKAIAQGRERSGVVWVDVAGYARLIEQMLGPNAPPGMKKVSGSTSPLPVIIDWGTNAGAAEVDATLRAPAELFRAIGRQYGQQ